MPILAIALQKTHIKISGPDARKFLQGQLSCDINEITPTQSRLAAHCNAKGRMISLGRVYQYQDSIYFAVPQSIAKAALDHLKHYAMFSKVSFVEKELQSIGIIGQNAKAMIEPHLNENLLLIELSGRLEIIGPSDKLDELAQKLNFSLSDDNTLWEIADIQDGLAFLSPETVGKFLPHDINLPLLNGVSFNKGCYIGQEIIARMQFLGKLKTKLVLVEVHTEGSQPGSNIVDSEQKSQGEIICQASIKPGQYLALALFKQAPDLNTYYLENQGQVNIKKLFNP
ncbi:MAG: ygfZ [Gammaproteobacteria bacterium]|jgi:folate-binding protein YgfZ|nr:ygfZ [Gammaproteobacteria bacterium]